MTEISPESTAVLGDASQAPLFQAIYADLKVRASRMRRGHGDSTLDTTALVHESFLKILDVLPGIRDREHLYRLAAVAMRQLLVDSLRERHTEKRGGALQRIGIEAVEVPVIDSGLEWASAHEAIRKLDRISPRMADVFLLRTFGDLGFEDIATLLACSKSSAHRDFEAARAFLLSINEA